MAGELWSGGWTGMIWTWDGGWGGQPEGRKSMGEDMELGAGGRHGGAESQGRARG